MDEMFQVWCDLANFSLCHPHIQINYRYYRHLQIYAEGQVPFFSKKGICDHLFHFFQRQGFLIASPALKGLTVTGVDATDQTTECYQCEVCGLSLKILKEVSTQVCISNYASPSCLICHRHLLIKFDQLK